MRTRDALRNVRAMQYEAAERLLAAAYPIETVNADAIEGRSDVMFYFTGLARVPAIETNRFLDGAVADHLTWPAGCCSRARRPAPRMDPRGCDGQLRNRVRAV